MIDQCRQLVLVGEDNPLSDDPGRALCNHPPNCAGWRLQRILGLDDDTYLSLARTNLCNPTWDLARARERARLIAGCTMYGCVVMLGRKVTSAFEHVFKRPLRQCTCITEPYTVPLTLVSLPHPSGRCRFWNDGNKAIVRVRQLLRDAWPHIKWGSA